MNQIVLSQESFNYNQDQPANNVASNAFANVTINHTERNGHDTIA